MQADRVEVSWDQEKHKWLIRIQAGLEVIRRHCNDPKDIDREKLLNSAEKTVLDEGYEFNRADISLMD